MNVRSHVSMVFHLDKCIGCHTCSVACKNIWTDREGAEYMWWNNVETKPGTGFPVQWENQEKYKGGWKLDGKKLKLKSQSKTGHWFSLFYNPNQPGLDEYYEPWTYKYQDLFDAPAGDDQPTAIPVSKITGQPIDIKAGPNWDDDLSGSTIYAKNDPNFGELTDQEKEQLLEIENIAMMYLPRICNHCTNPSCVAACPSGAIYKRGEDGIVLINQDKCRGWRACVAACPYKKIYYNWKTGKSEKCILCYPRLETGQAPACFHSCVGRIRYMGVILYDADRIEDSMKVEDHDLVESQRSLILNPFDADVIAAAKLNGITPETIEAAQHSPVYKYVMEWKLALPLHIEYRTAPMLFYVPPLLPVMGRVENGIYNHTVDEFFSGLGKARMTLDYLSNLFSAGNKEIITYSVRKMLAVRYYRRFREVADFNHDRVKEILAAADCTPEQADAIYEMTSLPTVEERFVLAPMQREMAIEPTMDPEVCKSCTGFGTVNPPARGN
ncbi:MAG: nitrate reductase subunit beta [Bacteroidetes bacterium]|nr:nitrate reductase subunit beta [Bacteroidota bacterium]